jgi:hypothetical protein
MLPALLTAESEVLRGLLAPVAAPADDNRAWR